MGLCQPCLQLNRFTPFAQVDHIKAKAQGGEDELDNLQCICGPCHDAKTALETGFGLGRKEKPSIGLDGWPVKASPKGGVGRL